MARLFTFSVGAAGVVACCGAATECDHATIVHSGEDELVDGLNSLYTNYDADDATSPNGVTMRMADDFIMYCGGACFQGNPDCRLSASLYSSKMMFKHDTFTPAVAMGREAGIIFNQTTVEASTGKCAYMYDGASFGRVNRGCGCAARRSGCGEQGAYWNQDCEYSDPVHHEGIDRSTCHNNTDTSEDVEQCWCNADDLRTDYPRPEDTTTESMQCFFRAGGLYPPHPLQPEFHQFVQARIAHQEANGGIEILPNGQTRYKSEFWNEVVVDAEVLGDMLRNPDVPNAHAVSAFMYVEGHAIGKQKALDMQQQALRDYGYPLIPIVAFDDTVDVRCSGPFRKATDLGPPPSLCVAAWEQCSDTLCCQDGLTCVVENPYYATCQPSQAQFVA